jgi:hypothetical protein
LASKYQNKQRNQCQCLKENHAIKTVGDIFAEATTEQRTPNAACNNQKTGDKMANSISQQIPEKWNPDMDTTNKDNLDHTPQRKRKYETIDPKEETIFNPDITERGHPLSMIIIFGTEGEELDLTKITKRQMAPRQELPNKITLYITGETVKKGSASETASFAIWESENSNNNYNSKIQKEPTVKKEAILLGIIKAMANNNNNNPINFKLESIEHIQEINQETTLWENHNWIETENNGTWKKVIEVLRKRTYTTAFTGLQEEDKQHFKEATKLAQKAERRENEIDPDTTLDPEFQIKGARLQTLTSKVTYRNIIKHNKNFQQPILENTQEMMGRLQDEIENKSTRRPLEKEIWKGHTEYTIT